MVKLQKFLAFFLLILCLLSFLPLLINAVTVGLTAVNVTSVHTCPLDQRTFVVAYSDEDNDDVSFQIYDTNGTQIVAETDVDTTVGALDYTSVGVSAFNDTDFVIGWYDKPDADATFAVYNRTGSLITGPTDANTQVGSTSYSVQVACFNSTLFIIAYADSNQQDATFDIYNANGTKITGPIDVDTTVATTCNSVSVSCFNSTHAVIGWNDAFSQYVSFAIVLSNGTISLAQTNVDTTSGTHSYSVSVSCFNSTHFVIGWHDDVDLDATFAVYTSAATLVTGPIDADTNAGADCYSVQVDVLNDTAFIISWYNAVDFDLMFATYLSNGTAVAAATDIESWPTSANTPFLYQSPCSQETANNIKLYNDNWIIAYANTTTQADWQAFMPNGTAWDGTIPAQGGPTILSVYGIIPITFSLSVLNAWVFNRYGSITMTMAIDGLMSYTSATLLNLFGIIPLTFNIQNLKSIDFFRESLLPFSFSIDGLMTYTSGTFLTFFGIIPITFQLDSARSYLFNRYGIITFHFPFATSNSLPITVVVPTSNLGIVLGGFAVVMVFVCLALVLNQQPSKTKPQRDDGNNR